MIKRDKYTRIMRCSPNARIGNHARDLHRPLLSSSSLAHFARIDGHQRVLTFTFSLMRRKRTPLGNEQTMSAKKREQRDPADFDYDYEAGAGAHGPGGTRPVRLLNLKKKGALVRRKQA